MHSQALKVDILNYNKPTDRSKRENIRFKHCTTLI
jgi:hypothetical protein